MNRHLTATYTLSILIVVATAVAFRGVEGRPAPKPDAAKAAPGPATERPDASRVGPK